MGDGAAGLRGESAISLTGRKVNEIVLICSFYHIKLYCPCLVRVRASARGLASMTIHIDRIV
jgi:hypothetical protein